MSKARSFKLSKIGLLGLCVAAASSAIAQGDAAVTEEVVVTGFRQSLEQAAVAKRSAVNVTDSVFAEDIGKFADLNIAEAINRVPGMQLEREVDGSGVNISIRGLGTNFSRIIMNGTPVAVATSGRTDSQSQNREVDLDLFPTEFFTKLEVSKTTTARQMEGGVAGLVNMQSVRPFDSKEEGGKFTYQVQGGYGELSETISPRLSGFYSWTNDTVGFLVGLAAVNNKTVTEGYETFGWTNPRLTQVHCGETTDTTVTATGGCDGDFGGNNWTIPNVVPANAGAGLVEGTVIDDDYLLGLNPGATLADISQGIIPRIGRPHYTEGDRDRTSALFSFEFRPSDEINYYADVMVNKGDRSFNRLDIMMVGRNSVLIPTNLEVDENFVVTSADYANGQFFLEARPYDETVDYFSFNNGISWDIADDITFDGQLYTSKSDFRRDAPTVGVTTNLNQDVTIAYRNDGGPLPVATAFDSSGNVIDLNDPNQAAGWGWERALIQSEERDTKTSGLHLDFTFGDAENNVKTGLQFDNTYREIVGLQSDDWAPYACGDPCRGGAGAAIPNDEVYQYLVPSDAGFISVDYNAIFEATNYYDFLANVTTRGNSATGARSGIIDEENTAAYIEVNTTTEVLGKGLRTNLGLRYIETDQVVESPGADATADWDKLESSYEAFLPSLNLAWDVAEDLVLRASASQTMTRANPTQLLPQIAYTDTSAQGASIGNPALSPFKATNGDLSLEWYTGDEGYVAATYFEKQIVGFTVGNVEEISFNELAALSQGVITWENISGQQQDAIIAAGGRDEPFVNLSSTINADGLLNVEGFEFTWSQPLDMVVEGLGFNANYTTINQKSTGNGIPAFITGTADETYNFTTYYEQGNFMARVSYTHLGEMYRSQGGDNGFGQPGTTHPYPVQRFQKPQGQWDASAAYTFENLPSQPQITLNIINFAGDPQKEVFQFDNAPYLYYDPGYQIILGLRGTF